MSEELKTWPARRLHEETEKARAENNTALVNALSEVDRLREICIDIVDLIATDPDIIFDTYSPTEILGRIDDIAQRYFMPEEEQGKS